MRCVWISLISYYYNKDMSVSLNWQSLMWKIRRCHEWWHRIKFRKIDNKFVKATMVEWTLDIYGDTLCMPSDPTQFSRFAWKMSAIHWADTRVKRSGVYSRINFDDRKKSSKQMTEEVAIWSGVRILEMFSPKQTVRSTIIHLFHTNNQLENI